MPTDESEEVVLVEFTSENTGILLPVLVHVRISVGNVHTVACNKVLLNLHSKY